MSEHTPGPWKLLKADDPENPQGCFDAVRVAHKRYITVEGRTDVEANANARLIAAAPDLLEAAKAARWVMQNEYYNKPRIGMEAECALLDAAIAKTEGGEDEQE